MRTLVRSIGLLSVLVAIVVLAGCASTATRDTPSSDRIQAQAVFASIPVSTGSPTSPFPQNKQNEPAVAIDPHSPNVLVAGSNDEIDLAPCDGNDCPFTPGVGLSGVYFSSDGGASWKQPTYTGWSARTGTAASGPIGTLPHYFEAGLVSDGDPTIAFGPRPGADGTFSWTNGSRLYYGNLTSNFPGESAFKGFEAIAVSHTDDVAAAAAGDATAWSAPVLVSKQNSALFSDKDGLWADNAATSPYFGHVYLCNVAFRGAVSSSRFAAPEPVLFARSTDGGETWSTRQISSAANTGLGQGRQGCAVRTDSQGTIYVFFASAKNQKSTPPVFDQAILMVRSTNGGRTFEAPRAVADVTACGKYEPVFGDTLFDGVAGARTNSFPSVDIANGAPSGADATDTIALTWCDASAGLDHETAQVTLSSDGGFTWSAPVNAAESGDRPDFPSVAVSPDGSDLYVTYMGFITDYQSTTASPRTLQGVVRHSALGGALSWTTLHRGATGDARTSSANSLAAEFLGDYTYVAATRSGATAVWTDAPGADCPAVDAYRYGIATSTPVARPAPATDCPTTFGNTDITSVTVTPP